MSVAGLMTHRCSNEPAAGRLSANGSHDRGSATRQDSAGLVGDPDLGPGITLLKERPGGLPHILKLILYRFPPNLSYQV